MRLQTLLHRNGPALGLAALFALANPTAVYSADSPQVQDLERRIAELERMLLDIRQAQAQTQVQASAPVQVAAPAKEVAPVANNSGNELQFSAIAQFDARFFVSGQSATGAEFDDGFLLRRIRPTWSGKVQGIGFRIVPELSGNGTGANISLLDAFADVPVAANQFVRIGKQKTAVSIDRIRVATALPLIERGLANELAPNRDLGLSLNSSWADGRLNTVFGLFNGAADGRDVSSRDDAGKEIQARVFAEPFIHESSLWKGLGFGVSLTHGSKKSSTGNAANTANTLARYRSASQEEFFTYANGVAASGTHHRLFPQLSYFHQNWGVVAEYGISEQELTRAGVEKSVRNTGYDLTLSWVPTGQPITFRGVKLGQGNSSGAVELAFRVSGLDIDDAAYRGGADRLADPDVAARKARNLGVGLNWHINKAAKWSVDFNSTQFSGGALGGRDRQEEQIVMSRFQLVY